MTVLLLSVAGTIAYFQKSETDLQREQDGFYLFERFSGKDVQEVTTTTMSKHIDFDAADINYLEGLKGTPLEKISFILGSLGDDLLAADFAWFEISKIIQNERILHNHDIDQTDEIEDIIYNLCVSDVFTKKVSEDAVNQIAQYLDKSGHTVSATSELMIMMKRLTKLDLFSRRCLEKFVYS
ncbi:hypothetical protein [Roseibium sp.]|uniref:hypothetical protein n=1 Tax=Roseibium sp. TaxID=1936156 RepID=UPI003B52349B